MAPIPAPGVAMARVRGTIGVNPWAVVLHFYNGTATIWSQAQINALATAVSSRWTSGILPQQANNVRYISTLAVDLTDNTQRISETPLGNLPGTGTAESPTLASCILISHRIASRYRGGHPRSYLPPPSKAQVTDGDNWQSAFVSTMQTAWNSFVSGVITDIGAAGVSSGSLCAPRYTYSYTADNVKHKFVKTRTSYQGPFPISSSVVSSKIATQRRRLGV